jgi:selenocysteine-specific elongation factor
MDVVCTAGHVDHGKSTLVRALTGMEPDRFAEERRRGLTIDIGFAWTRLDGGRTLAFVDLPGHERFIANMLAGAGPVECALLVVAADEGWKPQTQEHTDILALLQVSAGVVAITKADAVDAEQLARTTSDVRARLAATTLAGAPIVAVAAPTGQGLDDLRAALSSVLDARPPVADHQRPRLWIDRSFSIKGAGTVVTGTLGGGTLRTGDDVTILPGGHRARIRGLQSLKSDEQAVGPGARVAVNLAGLPRDAVGRGDALVVADQWLLTDEVDAWVRILPTLQVGQRGAWHLHAGSGEWVARVRPLGASTLRDEGYVRLQLRSPAALTAGDRFVLRDAGRRVTVAGGIVLDPVPQPLRSTAARRGRSEQLDARRHALVAADRGALLNLHVAERGAATLHASAAAAGLTTQDAVTAAAAAGLLTLGPALAHPQAAAQWTAAVDAALRTHHRQHPVDRTAPRDVALRAAAGAGCPDDLAGTFLDVLVRLGRVAAEGTGIRHPDHTVRLDPAQQRARDALLAALNASPFSPPGLADTAAAAAADPALVRELEAAGELVRIAPDIAVTGQALTAAVQRLRSAYAEQGPTTAAQAKEALATTRKYALPLLEELDRRGITQRRGDVRDVR